MSKFVKSPLNYTGGKFKLLEQLIPLFPEDKSLTFVDLFCGGCNVAANVEYKTKIAIDAVPQLIQIFNEFKSSSAEDIMWYIDERVKDYGLSKTNKDGFVRFKNFYNEVKNPLDLYVLICHSFSNQMRFNKSGEFNLPFGQRTFNSALRKRLPEFVSKVKDVIFVNTDYKRFHPDTNSFVFCDPPYLISTATYNEQGGWTNDDEQELLDYLDTLDAQGVKFGLTNVLRHKGNENTKLIEWSSKYKVHPLYSDYTKCNYQTKVKDPTMTEEVYICNY